MTDNTQELDKILGSSHCDFTPENINEYSYNQICKWCGAIRSNSRHKIKQALLDWHNKQVEELLDRLEQEVKITIYDGDDSFGKEYQTGYNSMAEATRIFQSGIMSAIEAERAKLKEVK